MILKPVRQLSAGALVRPVRHVKTCSIHLQFPRGAVVEVSGLEVKS